MKARTLLRGLLIRLTALLFGLTIGLLIVEIVARLWLFGWEGFNLKKVKSFTPISYSGYIKAAENQQVWYEIKPNIDGYFKMETIKTNSQGLRDKEYSFKKPPNTFRIAVIGDSYTFGDGVKLEDTYHAILEQEFKQQCDMRYEFINFGVGGYNLLNYLGVIQEKALDYDPDLILIGFCGNNDDDIPNMERRTKPYQGHRFEHYAWFIRNLQFVRSIGAVIDIQRRKKGAAERHRYAEKKAFVTEMFGEFGKLKQKTGVPILVYYLAMQDAPAEKAGLVADLCAKHGLGFADSSVAVDSIKAISQFWFHPTDHHPNPAMHRIYAKVLCDYLLDNLPNCPNDSMTNVQ